MALPRLSRHRSRHPTLASLPSRGVPLVPMIHRACENAELRKLLTGLVEGEDQPCRFDHHGYCQEHGWFGEPGECYLAQARTALGLDEPGGVARCPAS